MGRLHFVVLLIGRDGGGAELAESGIGTRESATETRVASATYHQAEKAGNARFETCECLGC